MEHLVEAGLAEVTGDGWEIDWSTQIPAEEVSSIRGKWAARKRHYRGNHTDCATWGIKGCDKVSHETSTKTSTVESHPIREGKETEEKRREEKRREAKLNLLLLLLVLVLRTHLVWALALGALAPTRCPRRLGSR